MSRADAGPSLLEFRIVAFQLLYWLLVSAPLLIAIASAFYVVAQ
jgi:hypothetical protein